MTGLRYDPEYFKAIEHFIKGPKPEPAKTAANIRTTTNGILRQVVGNSPYPPNVTETAFTVKSYDGAEIEVTRFASEETTSSNTPTPAVVYLHGGGFVAGSVKIFAPQIARLAQSAQLPVFAVSYRLAPESPAPAGVEDAYAALRHLSESSGKLNIDPARLAIYGDSAGGGVAAGAALMARDRQLQPPLAKQILIYPMLDDRTSVEPDDPSVAFMTWDPHSSILAWDAYASKVRDGDDAQALSYAAPARAVSLQGLPPTYLEVGSLDLFRDENLQYAKRLATAHVEVELHLWPGLPHGFDGLMTTSWFARSQENRLDALKRIAA